MLQSHPRAERYRRNGVAGNGFANGVARALNEARRDRRFFACFPQRIDDYLVTAVLHVDRAAYDRHLALAHAGVPAGFANGVARALNEARRDRRFFACFPQRIDDYLVTAVLHVDRAAYDRHLALAHAEYLHRFSVATSLLHAAVRGFLSDCSGALRDPDAGAVFAIRTGEPPLSS